MVSYEWKGSSDREIVKLEYSGEKGRRGRAVGVIQNHVCPFALGIACVFNFLLAFCNESFNEAILDP